MTTTRLALDCSFAGLSLCLWVTGGKDYAFSTNASRSSDLLPTELNTLFTQSGTTAANLTRICVTIGPGSFTGIRLGLATAEALKLLNPALDIIALPTLQALALQIAAGHQPQEAFTIALDAAGGQLYTQSFDAAAEPLTEAAVLSIADFTPQHRLYASPSLMLDAKPLDTFHAAHLFTLAENPAAHRPAAPLYLKPLTYRQVS